MNPAVRFLRWLFDFFAQYAGVVVIDATAYREAVRESERLLAFSRVSGNLPNRTHARRQVRFSSRRIASRMREAAGNQTVKAVLR